MVIDGIDFMTYEQRRQQGFDKGWYSYKSNGPGVRYEMGTCIATGDIVWFHGPFPAGKYNDLRIFQCGLKNMLLPGEKVVADKAYKDLKCYIPTKAHDQDHLDIMNQLRARHEQTNGRVTIFGCFRTFFRHDVDKHHLYFKAAVVMTQIAIENGRQPFYVEDYFDPAYSFQHIARERGLRHLNIY